MTGQNGELDRAASVLPKVLKAAGAIIAPGTVVTALLFYFGWLHAFWFCYYFGVHSTVLGLTLEDYLLRSSDGLFVPMTVVAGIALVVAWSQRLLRLRLTEKPRERRVIVIGAVVLGVVLSLVGILDVLGESLFDLGLTVAPLSLATGVLLLMFASRLLRAGERKSSEWVGLAEWSAAFVVVSICAFWAAADYASSVGLGRAQQVQAELRGYPGAVLYSAKSLSLAGPGVTMTPCANPDGAYRYRYDGLRLVLQSGNQYFFLPQDWSPGAGAAMIVPRSESMRLEFTTASSLAPCGA